MAEFGQIAEDILGDESATGSLAEMSGEAGEEMGTITGESEAEQTMVKQIQTEVDAVADLEASSEPLGADGEESWTILEADGTVESEATNAEPNAEEKAATGIPDEEVKAFRSRFVNKMKTICTKLKSLATGPFGKTLIKAAGEVAKYWFITDMMKQGIAGLDQIVKDATGHSHPNMIETDADREVKTKLTNFLTVLSAFFNIVSSMKDTLNNAVTLSTSGDMDKPGTAAYLYAGLSLHVIQNINNSISDAATASTDVLTNIASAYTALGFSPASSTRNAEKVIPSVTANPQLLTNAIKSIDLRKLDTFTSRVNEMVTTAKKGFSANYKGKDYDMLMAYFLLPDKWEESETALKTFIKTATS